MVLVVSLLCIACVHASAALLPTCGLFQGVQLRLHAVSLLHTNVKSDNVVWNTADMWHLADYGAWPANQEL